MNVKRYDLVSLNGETYMAANEQGGYVLALDYDELRAELAAMKSLQRLGLKTYKQLTRDFAKARTELANFIAVCEKGSNEG